MVAIIRVFLIIIAFFGVSPSVEANPKSEEVHPVVILGSGISGQTAALNLLRGGIVPLIIEGAEFGGAITQSPQIENWPGEKKISGWDLVNKIHGQIQELGAQFMRATVTNVDFSKRPYAIHIDTMDNGEKKVIFADTCIIAMGSIPRKLNIPGETKLWTKGIYNCALCDGALFRDQKVAIVGGGDSALIEAEYLANLADVYLIVRRDVFRTHEKMRVHNLLNRPNVHVLFNTRIEKILEENGQMGGLEIKNVKNGDMQKLEVQGLFEAIGAVPNTKIFKGMLPLDKEGYIRVNKKHETKIPGVFAVGDITQPSIKQALNAASTGANAAIEILHNMQSNSIASMLTKNTAAQKTDKPLHKNVISITSAQELEDLLKTSSVPVFVDFYATWCGPCRYLMPILEEKAPQLYGKVQIAKVNVDNQTELVRKYQIRSMPTIMIFDRKGKIITRKIGTGEITKILDTIETFDHVSEIDQYLNSLR